MAHSKHVIGGEAKLGKAVFEEITEFSKTYESYQTMDLKRATSPKQNKPKESHTEAFHSKTLEHIQRRRGR